MQRNVVDMVPKVTTFESFDPQTDLQQKYADGLTSLCEQITQTLKEEKGFERPKMVSLFGEPGRGKTHLLHAMVNYLRENLTTNIESVIYLQSCRRDTLLVGNLCAESTNPIIMLDDLFANANSLDDLGHITELEPFADLLYEVYEENRLLITSSNFPIEGIRDKIRHSIDTTGRITSRFRQMASTNLEMDGPDYRDILAELETEENEGDVNFSL